MFDVIKVIYRSLRDGHISGLRVDNRPMKWVGFILWVPFALVLYAVFMGIFWVAWFLLVMPLLLFGLYWFTRKEATYGVAGIQFTKAYGRCLIPWSEVQEITYRREPTSEFYRLVRTMPNMKAKEYTIASTPDNPRFEETLRERKVPFRRVGWMDEPLDAEPNPPAPDSGV